jgi:hypothetical protein
MTAAAQVCAWTDPASHRRWGVDAAPVWFLSPGEDGILTLWPKSKPQREPVEGPYQPVEGRYHDDLSAFFKQQSKVQAQVEAVEAFYVDDLPAYFKQLKKR